MLHDSIKSLILEEQARQNGLFVQYVDMDTYLAKLGAIAEIVSDSIGGRCRGFVAYYCNDMDTKIAFISLVLVDPRDRGLGLGQALTAFVLSVAKQSGIVRAVYILTKQRSTKSGGARTVAVLPVQP